jgi:hypothetical protein
VQKRRRTPRRRKPWWATLPTEELLDVRLCDLDLQLEGSAMAARIDKLHDELHRTGLVFRPYVYLSVDWFTPEESTGFAVPFYLAHRRLAQLEHHQMFEAEGTAHDLCMKLLRHEAAHAFDNAYRLHRRADWRETFGRYSAPYRSAYRVRPTSKHFVQHLDHWYAQSHPAEDWAESFAVWMTPQSRWRQTYADWPALQKLEALDTMVRYASEPWRFDRELKLVFAPAGASARREHAATFLLRERVALRARVSSLTGQYRYVVDQVLETMVQRCRELDLRIARPGPETRLGAAVLTTMATQQLARGHRPRFRR